MHRVEFRDQVVQFLNEQAVEAYFVGGYVRDLLLKHPSNDIDIAVNADAIALGRRLADAVEGHFVLLDDANGIARVVAKDGHEYTDLSALRAGELAVDLAGRDFTFNALAIRLGEGDRGRIIDLFGGQEDMRRRRIRVVRDSSFIDDPLRLARAVRFAAQLGWTIEAHTSSLARAAAPLLPSVAAERVRDEFAKILEAAGAWRNLHLLSELGLLSGIVPEVEALRGFVQPSAHYYDVLTHSLATVDAVEETLHACRVYDAGRRPAGPPHAVLPSGGLGAVAERVRPHFAEVVSAGRSRLVTLKLAALFHDVAKPLTRSVDNEGDVHFYNHPTEGVEVAAQAMRRLRFSLHEIRIVTSVVANHMRPAQLAADGATARAVYRYFRDTGAEGVDTLFLSLADHIATRGPRLNASDWWQHAQFVRVMLEYYYSQPARPASLPKLISGSEIMRRFDLPAGPRIGQLIEELREAQATGEVTNRDQAVEFVRRRATDRHDEGGAT
jgi:putative nucleotidyltransferase with HDIG domain